MLHEFLSANRRELITRCRSKVGRRSSPPVTASELEYGVPLFLNQLVEALRREQTPRSPGRTSAAAEGSRAAALHGRKLLEQGYSVDQVVHDYGDICQSITELATEQAALVTVEEFHTLNRLLDNAIADAVASYEHHREESRVAHGHQELHERIGTLADAQRRVLDRALKALAALKVGNIGLMGATGTLLEDSLLQLRDLIDRSLPEIRLATGMTAPPSAEGGPPPTGADPGESAG
jgi:hypothetical protein